MTLLLPPLCSSCDHQPQTSKLGRLNSSIGRAFDADHTEIRVPSCLDRKVRDSPCYAMGPDQPLLGVPIREGSLWHLSTHDQLEPVTFSLYVNGFTFCAANGVETSMSLSPFTLVRNCRFQTGACSQLKSFKVSTLDATPCCYFAVRSLGEREAEEERSEWVLDISHTVLLITDSLLPTFSMTCDPRPDAPQTRRRLVAGYLLHKSDVESLSVIFCELQVHHGAAARFLVYENELCRNLIRELMVTVASKCTDIVGINCTSFAIDSENFATQTPSERKLWLRALSNVKVKVLNRAPAPDDEELQYYRDSIREHIQAIQATLEPRISQDALLPRCPKRPPLYPAGAGETQYSQGQDGFAEIRANSFTRVSL